MAPQSSWDRFCKHYYNYESVGLRLDISRMDFDDSLFARMHVDIKRAHTEMRALESGAIANPDENRMVGHYWLRNTEIAPSEQIRSDISNCVKSISEFAKNIHEGKIRNPSGKLFSQVLLIGIGGSALGPQLVSAALGGAKDKLSVAFIDNTDPDGIGKIVDEIQSTLDTTLVLVISKSGGTAETRNGQEEIRRAYSNAGLTFTDHAIAITCPGSALDKLAQTEHWFARFPLWDWVGGRTSLFSAVGLVPAALQGIAINQLLSGAREMDILTRDAAPNNPAMLLALMWHVAGDGRGLKDMVILPYKDRLALFSKYLQQLVMESLGKEKDLAGNVVHQGIAVYGNKGSTDQHAYVQQLREGIPNFFATFITVLSDYSNSTLSRSTLEIIPKINSGDFLQGFYQGTRDALSGNNRQSITITINELDAYSLGALIALYERAVGLYACLVNVNAYHQPGVEAGKKAAEEVIKTQQRLLEVLPLDAALSAEEIASAIGAPTEQVYLILEHLSTSRVVREGSADPQTARYSKRS